MEEVICSEHVKQCQTVIGELLWLATRNQDRASALPYPFLGAKVTKALKGVLELSRHVLGYLAATVDLALEYGPCSTVADQYGRAPSLGRLDILTDSSFAPAGGKGHQGLMAM